MIDYAEYALKMGFTQAAVTDVSALTIVPEYRELCKQNLCNNYDKLKTRPPRCGSVEEMVAKMQNYKKALVLCTTSVLVDINDKRDFEGINGLHNMLTDRFVKTMQGNGTTDLLCMSAGPWKNLSCMSAYCIDAQKMADAVGMQCWVDDGKVRLFSLILFDRIH